MPSSHLIFYRPLLLLPSIPPSIRVFSNESALRMKCPKYWSFSFSISPSNEHPRLISLRMDWLDVLAVQGTLKSLLQHHNSKASIFWCSALFTVQHSHPYMTTGKSIALTRRTFVGKVMSLLFNMLPRLVLRGETYDERTWEGHLNRSGGYEGGFWEWHQDDTWRKSRNKAKNIGWGSQREQKGEDMEMGNSSVRTEHGDK